MMTVFGVMTYLMKKILKATATELEKTFNGSEVYFCFTKRRMSLCFEILIMDEPIAKRLLFKVDWMIDEHFFQKNGLHELGWCCHYLLDKRSYNYYKDKQVFCKTQNAEFIWFNYSRNRSDKPNKFLESVNICKCMNCHFF